ncbi:MAG: hypothetical protein PHQ98_00710 [Candidatus ainarchaeum sp.]|nr:hypothetical protein [Candidatus ainarchaeum sp.]
MNFRKLILLFLFFVFVSAVYSASLSQPAYSIYQHDIEIDIDIDGNSVVVEKFYLSFQNENDKLNFRKKSDELGTDFQNWIEFNPVFTYSIGNKDLVEKTIVEYSDGVQNYIKLTYALTEQIVFESKESTFMKELVLKTKYFDYFYDGSWVIPDNTMVAIILPAGAEVGENIEPSADISSVGQRKKIIWNGYKTSNKLSLSYVTWKKITPVIDLTELINFLTGTTTGIIIIFVSSVVLAIILIKRKLIINVIEDFVEDNSKF